MLNLEWHVLLRLTSVMPLLALQAGLLGIELANITSQYGLHYRIGHAASNGIAGFSLGEAMPSH